MRGKDDAHIGPQSFVEVCKQHGLAQLVGLSCDSWSLSFAIQVDINSLKKTVLAELYPQAPTARKDPKASLAIKSLRDGTQESKRSPLTLAEVLLTCKYSPSRDHN
jgi:hypothetical protein